MISIEKTIRLKKENLSAALDHIFYYLAFSAVFLFFGISMPSKVSIFIGAVDLIGAFVSLMAYRDYSAFSLELMSEKIIVHLRKKDITFECLVIC